MTDTPPEKRKAGRPPKVLTEDQIREVETLAAVLSQDQIADYFGMCRNTFAEVMKRDPDISERYARGRARSIGAVAKSLITQALAGNMNAATFYLKTQAGWREPIEGEAEAETETDSDSRRKIRIKFNMG
jgi:hypothetical protein